MGYRNARDISNLATSGAFAVTNCAPVVTLDCDNDQLSGATGVTVVLGTLIKQLGEIGLINAAVSA